MGIRSAAVRLALAAAILAAGGCTPQEFLDRFKSRGGSESLRKGIELFNGGDLKEARPLLEKGVEENPNDANAHLYLGLALLKAKDPQAARTRLEKALELAPNNERVHFYLSELARQRRDFAGAEKHLRAALALSPGNFAILNNLGLVACEQKKYKDAIAFYSQALEKNRNSFVTFYNLGEAYRKSEQYSAAAKVFTEAQKLAPDNVYLCFSLAETYYYLKKHEEAIRQYTRILGAGTPFDQLGRVYFQLGVIYYNESKINEALAHFELASKAGYDRTAVDLWRAKVEIRQNRHARALDLLASAEAARAKSGKGNPAQIQYYKGVAHLNLDHFDEAIPCFKSALLFDLPKERVFAQLGTAHLKRALSLPSTMPADKVDEILSDGQEYFEKCLSIDKDNLVSQLGLAQVQFLRKQYEPALASCKKLLERHKDFPAALLQESLCYYQLKKLPEAVGGLEACLVIEPNNTNVTFFLAQIYAQVGRYADAENLFQKGLVLEPKNFDAMLMLSSVFARTGRYRDSSIMLRRIIDGESDLEVKKDARELFALVSKNYRDIVDMGKLGIKAKIGSAEYVEKRLQEPASFFTKAASGPLTPDERAELQDAVDRLVLDHNYLSTNNLFASPDVAKRYADGLKEIVGKLQTLQ